MTQIQLLFDQERKSVNAGDTELLKRVIRAEEGTLTGYIRKLEGTTAARPTATPAHASEGVGSNLSHSSESTGSAVESAGPLN